jgi:glycosyltransferase involved in cell wall biosynthesis
MNEILNEDLCIIIPVFKNEDNINTLIESIESLNTDFDGRITVTFVIDGSPDNSGLILIEKQEFLKFSSRILFHSKNFGSFSAIRTGLEFAQGNYFAVMSADSQEPPKLIKDFFNVLENDQADLVLGARTRRDDGFINDTFSKIFWAIYKKLVFPDLPKGGADVFACNDLVRTSFLSIKEPNSSLISQLLWLGYRRKFLPYNRQKRKHGKSAWQFSSKIHYMMDSIFSSTDLPIILALWTGFLGVLATIIFSVFLLIAHFSNSIEVPGYVSLALLISIFGSASIFMQGVLGSYLWRTFENTKNRPLRLISRSSEYNLENKQKRACIPTQFSKPN